MHLICHLNLMVVSCNKILRRIWHVLKVQKDVSGAQTRLQTHNLAPRQVQYGIIRGGFLLSLQICS
jgi:hypothetical protein